MVSLLRHRSGLLLAAAGDFRPSQIPNLQLWLVAGQGTYQDTALTTPAAADGDPVGGWRDQSGHNFHATQGTAANRPLLKLAITNGKPVLRFDGSNDSFSLTGAALDMLNNVGGVTCIAALAVTAPGTERRVFCLSTNSGTVSRFSFSNERTGALVMGVAGRRLDADGLASVDGAGLVAGAWMIESGIIDYANALGAVYKNGAAAAGPSAMLTPGNTSATTSGAGVIFVTLNAASFTNGDLAELLVWNRALNNAERLRVERYLGVKYGVAVA